MKITLEVQKKKSTRQDSKKSGLLYLLSGDNGH